MLFPAPAGMIPYGTFAMQPVTAFPRTRGDDPLDGEGELLDVAFSPHPRG